MSEEWDRLRRTKIVNNQLSPRQEAFPPLPFSIDDTFFFRGHTMEIFLWQQTHLLVRNAVVVSIEHYVASSY